MQDATAMLESLTRVDSVLLTGPVGPDGDSLGACLTLQRVLASRNVRADVAGDVPWRYAWMPGAPDVVPDADVSPTYQAVVVLDGDRHRLPPTVDAAFAAAPVKGIIDHHASTRLDGYTTTWVDPGAASTCSMLYGALEGWGIELDVDVAALLYTGVVFDTGGFRYSNTSPGTHRLAAHLLETGIQHDVICARVLAERRPAGLRAMGLILGNARYSLNNTLCIGRVSRQMRRELGLVPGDLEGAVDCLVHAVGTEVAALMIEGDDGSVKFSLRSRGQVDVSAVAQALATTGGGHAKAAGACVQLSLDAAAERLHAVVASRHKPESDGAAR